MKIREKICELEELYNEFHTIAIEYNAEVVGSLKYDEVIELNDRVESLKQKIIDLESEIYTKNPHYLGEINTRIH